jgi:hypothetical protein
MSSTYRQQVEDEIIADIVRNLDTADILEITGLREYIAKAYEDDIAERYRESQEADRLHAEENTWREARRMVA